MNHPRLSDSFTAAELYFYAGVIASAAKIGADMLADTRSWPDGGLDVRTRDTGQWISVEHPALRGALLQLGAVYPGRTIACGHGLRVDDLIKALAHNNEAGYDECLIHGLLQIAVLGTVHYDVPED